LSDSRKCPMYTRKDYLVPHSTQRSMKNRGLMRSKQQKMGFSRSVSQHRDATVGEAVVGEAVVGEAVVGEAVVGEAVVGEAVVGEAVGAAVGAVDTVVGEVVGVVVGQSVPRAVPVTPPVYATPVLRGTTGPHSPALV
jgi:hypothetical protein